MLRVRFHILPWPLWFLGVAIGRHRRAQPLQLGIVQRVPLEDELGELALHLEAVAPQRLLDEAVEARQEVLVGGPAPRD